MLSYPKFLSCQILPKELKEMVSAKIKNYLREVQTRDLDDDTMKNITRNAFDCLNFMNGTDLNDQWPQFVEYSKILDNRINGKTLEEIRPELGGYLSL